MSFWDFVRNIFIGRNIEKLPNESNYSNFRNPIWQNDDDGDDDDDIDDFRFPRGNIDFQIFNDPMKMTQYFESQMNSILKSFVTEFNNEDPFGFMNGLFTLPQEENLRNKMLKPGIDTFDNLNQAEPKLDRDLDGKVSADKFSSMWNSDHEQKSLNMVQPRGSIFGKSVRKEYIRKADGTLQQKQIIKDSEGNEETIISQQIGDKMYSVITKKDKNGVETKTENFVNIDEKDLMKQEWQPPNNNNWSHHNDLNYFPWEKFFKGNLKL